LRVVEKEQLVVAIVDARQTHSFLLTGGHA
jgi:hypothetical protein